MKNLSSIILIILYSCKTNDKILTQNDNLDFGQPVRVEIIGYNGNVMEPFISKDGNILLFNNLNSAPENTNLHWATKINDSAFQYKSEITGINTADLDAIASMDNSGKLFFISLRN